MWDKSILEGPLQKLSGSGDQIQITLFWWMRTIDVVLVFLLLTSTLFQTFF